MKVELLDHMGSDLDVVNAARVSFDKQSEWENAHTVYASSTPPEVLSFKDTKLISYLATHGHWSPFTHTVAKFRVSAPLFVARQLAKHQVGLSWNEVSRRYVDSEPEFYVPEVWRKRAENVKQGSSDEAVEDSRDLSFMVSQNNDCQLRVYDELLKQGVCPEQARMVLPQSMMTEWIWTGSLYAWARVYQQRTSEHAQRECKTIAEAIGVEMKRLFPVSWEALTGRKCDQS